MVALHKQCCGKTAWEIWWVDYNPASGTLDTLISYSYEVATERKMKARPSIFTCGDTETRLSICRDCMIKFGLIW